MNGAASSSILRAPAPSPAPSPASQGDRLASLAARMQRTGQWGPGQLAGRRWAMGCVSLEITQRCNLDCTSLIAYAQRYTVSVIPPDYQVAFTPYDWTVADSRRARLR